MVQNAPGETGPLDCAPGQACAAFALELYFKTLRLLDNPNDPLWGHNLEALYKEQSGVHKRRIRYHFARPTSDALAMRSRIAKKLKIAFTLDYCLSVSADAFQQMRYMFEGEATGFVAWDVISAVRTTILELEPSWGS